MSRLNLSLNKETFLQKFEHFLDKRVDVAYFRGIIEGEDVLQYDRIWAGN